MADADMCPDKALITKSEATISTPNPTAIQRSGVIEMAGRRISSPAQHA